MYDQTRVAGCAKGYDLASLAINHPDSAGEVRRRPRPLHPTQQKYCGEPLEYRAPRQLQHQPLPNPFALERRPHIQPFQLTGGCIERAQGRTSSALPIVGCQKQASIRRLILARYLLDTPSVLELYQRSNVEANLARLCAIPGDVFAQQPSNSPGRQSATWLESSVVSLAGS
jgi:hypothetical protein